MDRQTNCSAHLRFLKHDERAVGFLGTETNHRVFVSETPAAALRSATGKTWHAVSDTVAGIARAVTTGRGTQNFEGVIGITQLAGQAAIAGDTSIFTLIAILSANLALMNLLPIPVLGGGGTVFCALEWVRGRPLSLQLQGFATRTGLAAMLASHVPAVHAAQPDWLPPFAVMRAAGWTGLWPTGVARNPGRSPDTLSSPRCALLGSGS